MFKQIQHVIPYDIIPACHLEKKYIFSTDDKPHSKKPPKKDIEWVNIYNLIPKNNTEGSIPDITGRIINGQTIAPGHFYQTKTNDNFICAQSIFIDIDGDKGSPPEKEQAISMLADHGMHVNLVYDSFSYNDPKQPRYRLVLFFDKIMLGGDHYTYITEGIRWIFKEYVQSKTVDPCLTTLNQMYLGSLPNTLNYFDEPTSTWSSFPIRDIPGNIRECAIHNLKPNSYFIAKDVADLSKYDKHYGLRNVQQFDNQVFDKIDFTHFACSTPSESSSYKDSVENVVNHRKYLYIYNSPWGESPKKQKKPRNKVSLKELDDNIGVMVPVLRNVNIKEMTNLIQVLDDTQKRELQFLELRGVLLNMQYIEGGYKWVYNLMKENDKKGISKYKEKDYLLFSTLKKNSYYPQLLKNFSPYQEDWLLKSIYEVARNMKQGVVRLGKPEEKTLEEAQEWLNKTFNHVLNAGDNNIHLIMVPPGIGKSEYIARNFNNLRGMEICFPTHQLVDEMESRILDLHPVLPGKFYLKTRPMPGFMIKAIQDTVDMLLTNNDIVMLKNFLYALAMDENTSKEIMAVLNEINKLGTTIVMVTHDRDIVKRMDKRVVLMDSGRIIRDFKAGEYSNEAF